VDTSGSGQLGEEKILDPTGTRNPTPRCPARSQSLYRLSYPGIIRNPKKWKSDVIWQNLLRKAIAQKGLL
jgi:hypothetical protein